MEKYKIIYKDLFYKIKSGELPSGTVLPKESELAKAYGVSVITVKTALNLLKDDGLVLRKRRLGTVVKNGVVNNSGEKFVAIVSSNFDHLNMRFIHALTEIAVRENLKLSFFDSRASEEKEREILQYLLSEPLSGLILMPVSEKSNVDLISTYAIRKIPTVFLDFQNLAYHAPVVTSNNFKGMYEMTAYLVKCGHREIGFFPFTQGAYPTENERFQGYCKALSDHGIPLKREYLFPSSAKNIYEMIGAAMCEDYAAAKPLYEQYAKLVLKPTAIVCVNDLCAAAAISVLRSHGASVPDDVSVTGFDNLAVSVKNDITTVAQDFAEISKTALKTLIALMKGSVSQPKEVRLPTVIIRRSSVNELQD